MFLFQVQFIQNKENIFTQASFLANANCRAFRLTPSIKFCRASLVTFLAAERQFALNCISLTTAFHVFLSTAYITRQATPDSKHQV